MRLGGSRGLLKRRGGGGLGPGLVGLFLIKWSSTTGLRILAHVCLAGSYACNAGLLFFAHNSAGCHIVFFCILVRVSTRVRLYQSRVPTATGQKLNQLDPDAC
jgi:hypothetical protein